MKFSIRQLDSTLKSKESIYKEPGHPKNPARKKTDTWKSFGNSQGLKNEDIFLI
jgi:hypothetical protein